MHVWTPIKLPMSRVLVERLQQDLHLFSLEYINRHPLLHPLYRVAFSCLNPAHDVSETVRAT